MILVFCLLPRVALAQGGPNQSYGQIPGTTVYGPPTAANMVLSSTSGTTGPNGLGQATAEFVDTCGLISALGCMNNIASPFAVFLRTVSGTVTTLPDSSTSVVTTIKVTEEHSAIQTLPVCQVDGKWYVVWETNAAPGGYSPLFNPPAGWTITWQAGGSPPAPNMTAGLTDIYSFQCDLPNKILQQEGFAPANAPVGITTTDSNLGTIGAATSVQTPNMANIVLNKPSTVVQGHTMIMGYYAQYGTAPTPPSGWTLIRTDSCNSGEVGTYYKVAGNSEPSSYTWTLPMAYNAGAIIDVGVTGANPVDQISPATCGTTPTLAGLSTSIQPENVVIFGAGSNGNVRQVGFSEGSLAVQLPANGQVPISVGYLTANYPTTPTINVTGTGAPEAVQMIALTGGSTYTQRPVLQGDGYAELTALNGTVGANDSINNFNINGDFNVKNPIYGAKGDGLTDDTASIQSAYNSACATAVSTGRSQTLWFPAGLYLTSFPIISNCSATDGVIFKGEGEGTSVIQAVSGALFPIVLHESSYYLSAITGYGAITAPSLATGSGYSLNWGTDSGQFYDLRDAQAGTAATSWANVKPINGATALSVEGFFNYTGGAIGGNPIYLFDSTGDDLNLGASNAASIYFVTGYYPEACITTTGSGHVCTSNNSNTITPGTTYEFQWSYDGADLRLFYGIPGQTTTLAGSVAATGTIVEQPSEVFALGDGGSGMLITGENLQANAHWIGQLDSIRISKIARNTSTYTAPTAKFASDSNTFVLLNNLAQDDVLLQVTFLTGLAAPVWIPLYNYETAALGTNEHAEFVNLTLNGGNYGLLGIGTVYTTLDHVTAGGASHREISFWNNAYGTRIEHLTAVGTPYSEAGLAMSHNSGLVNLQWLFQTGSYYGMEMVDAGGVYSMLFLNPGNNQVAGIDMGASAAFQSYSIHEPSIDWESGGAQSPAKIWGVGTYQFYGGDFQVGDNNVLQVAPGNAALGLSLFGGNVVTNGYTMPLVSWKGSYGPESPAMWINPVVNSETLGASGIALSDHPLYMQSIADATGPPTYAIANLPTCSATVNTGDLASVNNSDSACTFGSAPTHSSCTVGTNCYTCPVQCAEKGSTTWSWIAY